MSEENDKLAKLYENTAKKILDAMNEKDTRIKALEQQLREKESCCNCEYHLTKQANEKIAELTTKLSEAEARVKELEVSVEGIQSGGRNIQREMVAKMNELQSRLAQELERGKSVTIKKWQSDIEAMQSCINYWKERCYSLTALNESEKDKP